MKKQINLKLDRPKKKLSLTKEVIRELQADDLKNVVGGWFVFTKTSCMC